MLRTAFFGAIAAAGLTIIGLIIFLPTPEKQTDAPGVAAQSVDRVDEDLVGGDGQQSVSSVISAIPQTNSFAITDAQYFDGLAMQGPATLIIREGIVSDIITGARTPEGMTVFSAEGMIVIPGLIDAHTHSWGAAFQDAFRFGVTSHLDMFTQPLILSDARAQRESMDNVPAADMYSAGMLATSPGGHGTQFGVSVETLTKPGEAQAWVDARLAEGSDFIKLAYIPGSQRISSLDLATATAVIEAAHARGVLAVAHIGTLEAATQMVDAGIDGLVHIFADVPVSDEFIEKALDQEIFVIPTLSILASVDGVKPGEALLSDPDLSPFLTQAQKANLKTSFPGGVPGFDFEIGKANVLALNQAGVPILAGTDAPNPGTTYGATQHQEMEFFVDAGLSALEALAAGTSMPAKAFNLTGRGIIEPGARADLVFIKANPADTILSTRKIAYVVKNGFVHTPQPMDEVDTDAWAVADLGDFEKDLSVDQTPGWTISTDQLAGGQSNARVTRVPNGANGSGGAMHVVADVRAGFFVPWAGAFLQMSPDFVTGQDITAFTSINFDIRGTPGTYRTMIFNAASQGVPPTASFSITQEWKTISLPLSEFTGLETNAIAGVAIVAGPDIGVFEFDLDNIQLN